MSDLFQDVRVALRGFRQQSGFTATVVITLALGIGATTLVFSVVQGVLLKPMGFDDPERVVMFWGDRTAQEYHHLPITVGDYNDLKTTNIAQVGAAWYGRDIATGEFEPERVQIAWVTEGFLPLLGATLQLGAHLDATDESGAILTHDVWQRRYGSDPNIVGQSIRIGSNSLNVVGVLAPAEATAITGYAGGLEEPEIFRAMPTGWVNGDDRENGWLRVVGRLNDSVTVQQAQLALDGLSEDIRSNYQMKEDVGYRMLVVPVLDDLVSGVKPALLALLASVMFVLVIACANVANLLFARANSRDQEISVRSALGGGRGRIIRQMLTESVVLATMGGAAGIALATAGLETLKTFNPPGIPRLENVGLDPQVLGFSLVSLLASALVFGVLPAIYASKPGLMNVLRDRNSGKTVGTRTSQTLVVAEVALSLMLLVGSGLMIRTFSELLAVTPGYDSENVVTFSIQAPPEFEDGEQAAVFVTSAMEALKAVPGVVDVGAANRMPLAGGLYSGPYATEESEAAGTQPSEADYRMVTAGYLPAMGTRLLAGRMLEPLDGPDVALIDRRMADREWPGEDPLGKRVKIQPTFGDFVWKEVVGVVEHMRHENLREDGLPTVFFNVNPYAWQGMSLKMAVRSTVEPASLVGPIRETVRSISPNAPVDDIKLMRERFALAMASETLVMVLASAFGLIALTLAAVGLYGVIAYSVSRRTRDIGIRMAFGADKSLVVRQIVTQGLNLTAIGIVVGLGGAMITARSISGILFGVSAINPAIYAVVAVSLASVTVLACLIPARRAARIDPAVALRYE